MASDQDDTFSLGERRIKVLDPFDLHALVKLLLRPSPAHKEVGGHAPEVLQHPLRQRLAILLRHFRKSHFEVAHRPHPMLFGESKDGSAETLSYLLRAVRGPTNQVALRPCHGKRPQFAFQLLTFRSHQDAGSTTL